MPHWWGCTTVYFAFLPSKIQCTQYNNSWINVGARRQHASLLMPYNHIVSILLSSHYLTLVILVTLYIVMLWNLKHHKGAVYFD